MVPWSHLRQPSLGWVMTVLTAEFTHFNLVIHLSKSQQLAFLFCNFFEMSCRSGCPLRSFVNCILCSEKPYRTFRNLLFCSIFTATSGNTTWNWIRQAHVLQVWYSSFWWLSGEVKHFVHLIRWNLKAVLCPCGWLEHGPVVAQSHEQ